VRSFSKENALPTGGDQGEGESLKKTQNIIIWLFAHQLTEVGEKLAVGVKELL
jgi:hypothetical protein